RPQEHVRNRIHEDQRYQRVEPAGGKDGPKGRKREPDGAAPEPRQYRHRVSPPEHRRGEGAARAEAEHAERDHEERGLRKELERQDHDLQHLKCQHRGRDQRDGEQQQRAASRRQHRGADVHHAILRCHGRRGGETADATTKPATSSSIRVRPILLIPGQPLSAPSPFAAGARILARSAENSNAGRAQQGDRIVSEADLRTATTKRWAYMKARRRVSSKIVSRLPSTGEKSGYIESRTFKEPSRKVTRV